MIREYRGGNRQHLFGVLLTLGLLISARHSLPATDFPYDRPGVRTLQNNGDPRMRVDLVFLGDGYTESEERRLESDVQNACKYLWGAAPFGDYKQYFNVHLVIVPSARSGAQIDYAFGSGKPDLRGMVHLSKRQEVFRAASHAPGADAIIVLTTVAGRAHAGGMVVLAGGNYSPLPHELGHILGGLGDEYESSSLLYDRESHPVSRFGKGSDLPYPNLSSSENIDPKDQNTIRKTAKWGHFLDLPGAFPLVSAYQGGYYQAVGVWRPSYACVMNRGGAPFCPVCHESMVRAIFKKCSMTFQDADYHRRHPLSQWSTSPIR